MESSDRRRCRRLELRLPITRLATPDRDAWCLPACTANISSDGMYFHLPAGHAPLAGEGSELRFELAVPPGAGYSVRGGLIRGRGSVVRLERGEATVGLALRFDRPLEIDFNGAVPVGLQMGLA
ncbi:MAG: PilZ domain protein [Planctomycetes bacterium ADurb.Bin126]|nr:MAG: PilZ domain protein [Planctomycetes bacterium ADurb.Bin126]HOD81027.1 PilZ domain-containing protein [Phycisphaerae bacterium]HQL74539.1 PilZ domain-containing protein [Phycisphaerae bacterium]